MIFILVPSLSPTGPVKGAFALANALAEMTEVTLVSLKHGKGADAALNSKVKIYSLENERSYIGKINAFRRRLRQEGGRPKVAVISFCFSADFVSAFCKNDAMICSSVRGNLYENYRMDYGFKGKILAWVHFVLLNRFDHVVAMTRAMADQIQRYIHRKPVVIGNFVDEHALEQFRNSSIPAGSHRFVYLASLSARKMPLLLIDSFYQLLESGVDAQLDILGDGPLREGARSLVNQYGIQKSVKFHGHIKNPYPIVAAADVMVLPSLSEGLPRAALEALHLGVPCLLRDADGNVELIQSRANGLLFKDASELPGKMIEAAKLSRSRPPGKSSLLPDRFRQQSSAKSYFELLLGSHD